MGRGIVPVVAVSGMLAAWAFPALAVSGVDKQRDLGAALVRVADLDRPARHHAYRRRQVYREWYTPGQHWQPWRPSRHHRYWHGGVTDPFCYGIRAAPDPKCYERYW